MDMERGADRQLTFADMFCGIGGFHAAAAQLGMRCAFACDIDREARRAYESNFGVEPLGDITAIAPEDIPDHDLLMAGFPCQPFSIIGDMRGFEDTRGTLFFDLASVIAVKRPPALLLENVRQLSTHDRGRTLGRILEVLRDLGYGVQWKVLNALDFGLPQKRERTIIVATLDSFERFPWPGEPVTMRPLSEILETQPDARHYASEHIRRKRRAAHRSDITPALWHENKAGNISSHPWACALRAGASYNYLLVDGERRLTPREMLRLQGFPDEFKIVCNYSQTRKQAGNAIPVPMIEAAITGALEIIRTANALSAIGYKDDWTEIRNT